MSVNVTNTINKRFIDFYLTEKKQNIKTISKVSTEIHIFIIFLMYVVFLNMIFFIPFVGYYLFLVLSILQYIYYCLDYGMNYHNIYHIKKMSLISNNILYFLGFGFVFGIILINSNFTIAHVSTSLMIPIYVVKSYFILPKILKREIKEYSKYMFSIFVVPYWLSNCLIEFCFDKIKKD